MRPSWSDYLMKMAYDASERSDDIHTKHGCVFADSSTHGIISTGYNNTLRGRELNPEEYTRERKYKHFFHAEENCILNSPVNPLYYPRPVLAFITGVPCNGLFGQHPGCLEKLIQIGIRDIYVGNIRWSGSDNKEYNDYFEELVAFYKVKVTYMNV